MGRRYAGVINLVIKLFLKPNGKSLDSFLRNSGYQTYERAAIGAAAKESSLLGKLLIDMLQMETDRVFYGGP